MGILSYITPSRDGDKKKEAPVPQVSSNDASTRTSRRASRADGFNDAASTRSRNTTRSVYPPGDFRNSIATLDELRCDVMVNFLSKQQLENNWIQEDCFEEGVVLKQARSVYTCFPKYLMGSENGLYRAIETLNVRTAMTISTDAIRLALHDLKEQNSIPLRNGLQLQRLPNMSALGSCQKHQSAAYIADRGVVVVWDDDPYHLVERAIRIEQSLLDVARRDIFEYGDEKKSEYSKSDEKKGGIHVSTTELDSLAGRTDVETGLVETIRPTMLLLPIISASTLLLSIVVEGLSWKKVVIEVLIDQQYIRMALMVALIPQLWLLFFFMQTMVIGIAQIIGPIAQMQRNTKYYSGIRPERLRGDNLPHVTIQMPVYKEGLQAVIEPTVRSIKAAMATYEMQGGTANLFVNDDGLQLLSEEEADTRKEFYEEHNIGWVARPPHNPKPDDDSPVFLRGGKFKKASNMNFALHLSNQVEEKLSFVDRHADWSKEDEAQEYANALAESLEGSRAWAEGNIRMGDYILLIDSDTRVPADCFLDAVSEMEQAPQVAILQYSSGVMNVTSSYFEKAMTFFTNLVYTQIKYQVSCGDVPPFMGHNAFLRWSALQEISFAEDEKEKYWSEATVSEDFDMALRLQAAGFILRLATYQADGFREGVSLTVYDELSRWEKYAYGCSELIFNPFRYWFTRSPFSKTFRGFIGSGIPFASKITILAYMGSYYAIGSAWLMAVMNYFLVGWFNEALDHYYVDSFKVYFAITVVFTGLGQLSLAVLRYRAGERSLVSTILENLSWIPLLVVFLGGISLHVSQALVSHLFSIPMSWGATTKEAVDTTFFSEMPKVLKRFKGTLVFCIFCTAMMIVMANFAPVVWRITLFISIWPLSVVVVAHFLLPIALNPGLMRFTY